MATSLMNLVILTVCFMNIGQYSCNKMTEDITSVFFHKVIENYGSNGTMSLEELEEYLRTDHSHKSLMLIKERTYEDQDDTNSSNVTIYEPSNTNCVTPTDIFKMYNLQSNSRVNQSMLQELSPLLLHISKQRCERNPHERQFEKPPALSVWGYGFLMVTVINLCSLVGVLVLPFMKLAIYKELLIFMVALAVGALAGSGLLCLIPEAFGLGQEGDLEHVYKATTIMGGIYLFYLTEKIMRMVTKWKERRNMKNRSRCEDDSPNGSEIICSVKPQTPMSQDAMYKEASTLPTAVTVTTGTSSVSCKQELLEKSSEESNECACCSDQNSSLQDPMDSLEVSKTPKKVIKPLAWMIIFGDGLHNFIDGLSIGAAFTQSTLTGISVSVAVMCEELPHELGDFAILLNCGMSVKKALMYNFLSACMCYIGLVIGTFLGESTSSHDWVFAVAGGMFLYISLADMMPEMNSASEAYGGSNKEKQIFVIQNLGLIFGFGIMLILAIYGRDINFE